MLLFMLLLLMLQYRRQDSKLWHGYNMTRLHSYAAQICLHEQSKRQQAPRVAPHVEPDTQPVQRVVSPIHHQRQAASACAVTDISSAMQHVQQGLIPKL